MKFFRKIMIASGICLAVATFSGCEFFDNLEKTINKWFTSDEELTGEVRSSITKDFAGDPELKDVVIENFSMIKKSDNEYNGTLDVKVGPQKVSVKVSVIYDGKNLHWEISGEEMKKIRLAVALLPFYQGS
jgi:hypothetical protein